MAKQPETAREWLRHFDALQRKNAETYQDTGMQRYDDAAYKYECICSAFRAKIREESDRDYDVEKRIRNKNAAVDNLVNDKYTKDEVIKLLNEAVWW